MSGKRDNSTDVKNVKKKKQAQSGKRDGTDERKIKYNYLVKSES